MKRESELPDDDSRFMEIALKEAKKALELDEVPVGAIIVSGGSVIARAHNLTQRLNDATAHAEMQAITMLLPDLGGNILKIALSM